jgi:iron complex outermembrane receptor protein
LYGFEAGLTLHPNSLIHLENSFSLTRGKRTSNKSNLPFITAPALRNELRIEPDFKSSAWSDSYFSIEFENVFRQQNIDEEFETPTKGYTLVNASIGTAVPVSKQLVRIYVAADNIFDKAYVSHLSRLKYEGILNQGRNIAFGVILKFSASK